MGSIYDVMDELNPDEYTQAKDESKALGFMGDTALNFGTDFALRGLLKATGKSWPGLAVQAASGALYGGAKSLIEGDDFLDIIGNSAKQAVMFPATIAGFGAIGKAFTGARKMGIINSFKTAGTRQLESMMPDIKRMTNVDIGKIPGIGGFLEESAGARKLSDLFTPASETLANKLDPLAKEQAFNSFALPGIQDTVSLGAKKLGIALEQATVPDRMIVKSIFENRYSKPDGMNDTDFLKGMSILKPHLESMGALGRNLDKNITSAINNEFGKNLRTNMMAISTDDYDKAFLPILEKELQTGTKESIQQVLSKMENNQLLDPFVRETAKAWHDFPAKTIQEVNNIYRKSTTTGMLTNIAEHGQGRVVKMALDAADNPRDWKLVDKVPIPNNPIANEIFNTFKNQYVEWDTYRSMYEMADSLRYVNNRLTKYIVRPWKVLRAVANPPALVRNSFGNLILNDINGKHPLSIGNIPFYSSNFGAFRNSIKGKGDKFDRMFSDVAGKMDFQTQEMDSMINAFSGSKSMGETFLKAFHNFAPIKGAENLFSLTESFTKHSKFKWNLMQEAKALGLKSINDLPDNVVKEALVDAVSASFNYGQITPAIRALRETIIPFATFQSKIATSLPEAIMKHPWRVAKYIAIPAGLTQLALKNIDVSSDEYDQIHKTLPDYMQKGTFMVLPARDAKGRLQMFDLTWWLPGLNDLSVQSMADPKSWISNPLFTIMADLRANQKGMTNAPIWNEYDTGLVKTGKKLNYVYQNLMPTWMPPVASAVPGVTMEDTFVPSAAPGVNWQGLIDWYKEKEGSPTAGQVGANVFGFKTIGIDPTVVANKKRANIDRVLRDLKADRSREIKKNPYNAEEITSKYNYLLNSLIAKQAKL